jgi:hypothetical protein
VGTVGTQNPSRGGVSSGLSRSIVQIASSVFGSLSLSPSFQFVETRAYPKTHACADSA